MAPPKLPAPEHLTFNVPRSAFNVPRWKKRFHPFYTRSFSPELNELSYPRRFVYIVKGNKAARCTDEV
jgi:hypothetical protein